MAGSDVILKLGPPYTPRTLKEARDGFTFFPTAYGGYTGTLFILKMVTNGWYIQCVKL